MRLGRGVLRNRWRGNDGLLHHLFFHHCLAGRLVRLHRVFWLGGVTRLALGIYRLRLRWKRRLAYIRLGWGVLRNRWRGNDGLLHHLFFHHCLAGRLIRLHRVFWLGGVIRLALGIDRLRLRWRWRLAHMRLGWGVLRNRWRGNDGLLHHLFFHY